MAKKIDRRTALKVLGAGVLGVAGLTGFLTKRSDIISFLDADKDKADASGTTPVDTRLYKASGKQLSLLGFGAMRLPTKITKEIDTEVAEKMIDYAYRRGVNYFDTAYMYHNGKSEGFLGNALKKYPRDSFYLADKMPTYMVKSLNDAKRIFQDQLDRCGVTYFDNYLLHYVHDPAEFEQVYVKDGVLDYLKGEKAAGRIRQLGFSYHGDPPFFNYLIDNFTWDFVMIQLNYQDWNEPDETPSGSRIEGALYRKLEEKDLPVFVMEPVKGGRLASLPDAETRILKDRDPNRSIASWAIRFAASQKNVVTVLSGMSDLNQVVDNINTVTDFKPLTAQEQKLVQNPTGNSQDPDKLINCTACSYCMPCPYGVDIPGNFKVFNDYGSDLGDTSSITKGAVSAKALDFVTRYRNNIPKAARADHCIRCGNCLRLCPQHLPIPDHMRKIDTLVSAIGAASRKGGR